MGFALILLLISLIGGRITPAFTRNWLMRRGSSEGLPTLPNRFDMAVIGMTALALAAWIAGPASPVAAGLLIVAGGLRGKANDVYQDLLGRGSPTMTDRKSTRLNSSH